MSWSPEDFQGVNEGYVLELFERFQRDPQSVDAATREFFKTSPAFALTRFGEASPLPRLGGASPLSRFGGASPRTS